MKKQLAKVFAGEFVAKISQFLFEFFLVRLLSQSSLASWVVFSFILRFSPYASFGCLSYLNKFYPLASGSVEKQNEIKQKVFQNIIFFSLLFFSISILFLLVYGISAKIFYLNVGISFLVVSLILQYSFFQAFLRNFFDFNSYVVGLLVFCLSQLCICLFLYQFYGIYGVYCGIIFAYVFSVSYYFFVTKYNLRYQVGALNLALIKSGFPPFLLTIVAFMFQSMDRLVLMVYSNDGFLAFYAACFIFYQLGLILVNTAGKVISPFFLAQSSEAKSNTIIFGFLVVFSAIYFSFLMIFLFFGEHLLSVVLPNYIHLYKEIFCYMVIGYLVAYSQIFFNDLVKKSKENWAVIMTCIFFVLGFLFLLHKLFDTNDFYSFIEASLIINFIYVLCVVCLVSKTKRHSLGLALLMCSFPAMVVSTIFLI